MKRPRKLGKDRVYERYVAHMNDRHKRERWRIFIDGVALSLPLLAAFSWYVSLIFRSMSPSESGVYLSPGKTEPIVIFILVFIVAYGIFLMFEYNLLKKRLVKVKKRK